MQNMRINRNPKTTIGDLHIDLIMTANEAEVQARALFVKIYFVCSDYSNNLPQISKSESHHCRRSRSRSSSDDESSDFSSASEDSRRPSKRSRRPSPSHSPSRSADRSRSKHKSKRKDKERNGEKEREKDKKRKKRKDKERKKDKDREERRSVLTGKKVCPVHSFSCRIFGLNRRRTTDKVESPQGRRRRRTRCQSAGLTFVLEFGL